MAKLPEACCRHPGSRIGHGLLATAFLLVVLGCIISLSVFAVKHDEIQANLPDESDGDCILYVSRSRVVNDDIGDGGFCRFAIYGSVVVGLGAALYLIVFVIKLLIGVSLLTCFLIVEIPLLFCITAVSLAHSLNTAIGLALTCRALDAEGGYPDDERHSSCKDYSIPGENSGTKFFDDILVSEIISWAVTSTLMVLFVIYVVLAVMFWRKGTRPDRSSSRKEKNSVL